MKLTDKMNLVETGGTAIMADHLMKIREEDQHVVIGIIRHKMYSNPIRTLIQEVCSNARDAHREQGCIDRPIRVKLPDKYDNSFYIQDFGVGISPDRMENVFVNYGASTKRSNDEQTGGFGLGAKSPFSYTDQFGIVCVTPDKSGNLILRQYMAIIDGKNSYVKQVEERPATADEERGTTIVVPVKPEDFAEFRKWAIDRCRYWAVRPEIISKEVKVEWPADTVEFKGSDNSWEIHVQPKVNYYDRNREAAVPKAIVDGIPYPLDRSSIEKASDAKENALIAPLWAYPVLLHFKTGEVGLTATREELDYSDTRTAKMIRKKFKDIITELQAKIEKEISQAKDFIEASIKWNSIKSSYNNIVSKVTWNGHDVTGVGLSCHGLVKITQFYRDKTNVDGIGRSKVSSVSFSENLKFVYDITDSVGIARGKIVGMFESDPDLKNVYVFKAIAPDSLNSYNDIFKNKPKDFREKGTLKEVWDYFVKESKANLYNPVSIENLVRVKRKRATRVSGGGSAAAADVMAMRKFNNSFSNNWLSCDKDYKKDKGLVVYLKNREAYLDSACEISVSCNILSKVETQLGVGIYGVISRYADKLGSGWTPLADRVKSEFDKLNKEIAALPVPLTKTIYASSDAYTRINPILNKIDKNSDLFKFIENWKNEENNIKTYIAKTFKYNVFLEFLNVFYNDNTNVFNFAKKEIMLDSYADKLNKRYPYLVKTQSYHYCHITDNEKLEYIKAMDAYLGKF